MKTFTPEEEQKVLNSIAAAMEKARADGQPVRELAEAAAQGRNLQCAFVRLPDGNDQLVISLAEE